MTTEQIADTIDALIDRYESLRVEMGYLIAHADKLEAERDAWKAAHDDQVSLLLKTAAERDDLLSSRIWYGLHIDENGTYNVWRDKEPKE
jgi:hypothetical protein